MDYVFFSFIVLILGLILGSFATSLTWRIPKGISIADGRSKCPRCGHLIHFYDNIPVISYLILRGKCRNCKNKIPVRYPLIELTMGLLFLGAFLLSTNCMNGGYYFCSMNAYLGQLALPFLLFNVFLIFAIFIVDMEHQIIPDELVFIGWIATIAVFFMFDDGFYFRLLSGALAACFLLFLNLITRGRGMGLGDVKFALYGGMFFKPIDAVVWIFLSFIIGSVVGVGMIATKQTNFGRRIAFGPFLCLSLIICLVLVNKFNLGSFFGL